ncbi:hypothetical protein GH714_013018 [Hevea brasiliensis]|uniref:RNase H type-1 domain-containing protein n=1 Tax=Hevea brasiliensis TaxID=3981 RepID=A0A6A6MYC6_HEVBR|nr:hypothetical protein GH714_013018 [Hevea brasiliensis]
MSQLFSTLLFGDNEEFESFLGDELKGFMGRLSGSQESSPALRFPLLVLMGNEEDALAMAELATDEDGPKTQPASAQLFEKLEMIRIEESGRVGFGCIQMGLVEEILVEQGRWSVLGSFGFMASWVCDSLGICSAIQAELHALYHGLSLSWQLGYRRVEIQLDSMHGISMILGKGSSNVKVSGLFNQCHQFLQRSWEIKLSHCFREVNSVADRLANIAFNGDRGLLVLQDPLN